jgi:hypothetical protein
MAYEENPGMEGEMGAQPAPGDMPGQEMPEQAPAGASMTVTPDMLPEGMKLNAGDIVEFKVMDVKPDGSATVYYNTDEEAGKGATDSWEKGFRKEMSPTNTMNPESGNSGGAPY